MFIVWFFYLDKDKRKASTTVWDCFFFQTETALMYDAALLFATALGELDRSQVIFSKKQLNIFLRKNIFYSGHRDCDPKLRLWADVAARQLPDQLHEAGEEADCGEHDFSFQLPWHCFNKF